MLLNKFAIAIIVLQIPLANGIDKIVKISPLAGGYKYSSETDLNGICISKGFEKYVPGTMVYEVDRVGDTPTLNVDKDGYATAVKPGYMLTSLSCINPGHQKRKEKFTVINYPHYPGSNKLFSYGRSGIRGRGSEAADPNGICKLLGHEKALIGGRDYDGYADGSGRNSNVLVDVDGKLTGENLSYPVARIVCLDKFLDDEKSLIQVFKSAIHVDSGKKGNIVNSLNRENNKEMKDLSKEDLKASIARQE